MAPSRLSTPALAAGIAVSVIEASESNSGSVNILVNWSALKFKEVSSFVLVDQFVTVGAVLPTRTAILRVPETVLSGRTAGAAKSGIGRTWPSMPYSISEPTFDWSFL